MAPIRYRCTVLALLTMLILLSSNSYGAERIKLLALSKNTRFSSLNYCFESEPAVDFSIVLSRHTQLDDSEVLKMIRLYFPRTYEDFRTYDVLILACPTYNLFTTKQDKWIHDSIAEGAGGLNDGSVYSQHLYIAAAWSSGMAWQAFPNDAPTVTAKYGGWAPTQYYIVDVNEDARYPVLSVFIPYGVEEYVVPQISRLVIPRPGSEVLATMIGNYPKEEAYLTGWEYEEGRAMTLAGLFPGGWFNYRRNKYSPEMVMNMVFWLSGTPLIDDIEVYHRMKAGFSEFKRRIESLISLKEFIDRFGANTNAIDEEIIALQEIYSESAAHYLEHEFVKSEEVINSALDRFPEAEELARREKEKALFWVYVIEWLVSSSAFFISGFVLWTLMVRRRLYRAVRTTKLRSEEA